MKVLHLHESVELHGGAEVYISQINSLLPEYGCPSFWIGITKKKGMYDMRESRTGESVVLNSASAMGFIVDFIQREQIDIINIHSIFDPKLVKFCLSIRPVIKSVHSPVMVCPGRDKFWRNSEMICDIKYGLHCFRHIYTEGCSDRDPRRIIKAWNSVVFESKIAAKQYKTIIVMSDYIRQGLLECQIPGKNIALNPYFTEIAPYEPYGGTANGVKRLLFMGRLVTSKGPHVMLQALSQILQQRTDVIVDLVGDGLLRDDLQKLVHGAGLSEKVVFHGWKGRTDIKELLTQSYLVLFPSIYPEAFGIVGIEAMMYGKPVVAFEVGGVATWLIDGVSGFLIPRMDMAAMANSVVRLLDDRELYEAMSLESRKMAIGKFTPNQHLETLMEIYRASLS